jgi:nucleoside-diphosphate-sugar epimerase
MNKTILLTGGSGVVGQALLEQMTDTTIICLTRLQAVNGSNVIAIPGDVAQPQLGLSDALFHSLAQRVDAIVHSAAITDFTRPLDELRRSNVDGVRHMLDFAKAADVPLIHVSTAFIQARGGYALNNYESSKLEAEQVVRASGVPTVIVRPSIVIGDSQSGAITQFQGAHRIFRMFIKEMLPVVPGANGSYIDYVPQDSVAAAIRALLAYEISEGDYWLTAGETAIRYERLIDVIIERASHLLGRQLARPRVMKPDAFDRLVRPVFLPAFPMRLQRMFEEALDFTKYMNMVEAFPSSYDTLVREFGIPPLPSAEATLRHSIEYIVAQNKALRRTSESVTQGKEEVIA